MKFFSKLLRTSSEADDTSALSADYRTYFSKQQKQKEMLQNRLFFSICPRVYDTHNTHTISVAFTTLFDSELKRHSIRYKLCL